MHKVFRAPHTFLLVAGLFFGCATNPKSDVFESGAASWYGDKFHGRKTASGEIFNMNALTAAHPRLPFGTKVLIRSKTTRRQVEVRINDRGPFSGRRIIDLSFAAAKKLGILSMGEDEVEIVIL